MEDDLVREVPDSLKLLVKKIISAFYTIEDTVIISILLVHPCLKEDDLCTLLQISIKTLRARLAVLRKVKIIQLRIVTKAGTELDKPVKVHFYFIDYRGCVNVLQYKMDLMYKRLYDRNKPNAEQLAGYKCTVCSKTYTEIQLHTIIDFKTSAMNCSSCGGDVEVVESNGLDVSDLLKKFNEQFGPLVKLLQEVQNITLAHEIIEPQPVDIEVIRSSTNTKMKHSMEWLGEVTRSSTTDHGTKKIEIVFGEVKRVPVMIREQPIWLTVSTVINANETGNDFMHAFNAFQNSQYFESSESSKMEIEDVVENPNPQKNDDSQTNNEEILSMLLAHENRHRETRSSRADMDMDVDDMENDNFNQDMMEISDPILSVGNRVFNFTEINNEIIETMTDAEKDEYVRVFHIMNDTSLL